MLSELDLWLCCVCSFISISGNVPKVPLYHTWLSPSRDAMKENPWGEGSHRPPCSWWLARSRAGGGWVGHTWTQGNGTTGQDVTPVTRGSKTFPDQGPGLHFLVSMAIQGQPQSQLWLHGWHVHPAASVLPVPGPCLAWSWEIFGPAFGCLIFSFLCNTGLRNCFCSTFFLQPHTNRCLGSKWYALSRTDCSPILVNEVLLLVRSMAEIRLSPSALVKPILGSVYRESQSWLPLSCSCVY